MKYILILAAAITVSGCTDNSHHQLYSGAQLPPGQEVVVTSRADEATVKMAESVFGFKPSVPSFIQADGQTGTKSSLTMNSGLDGSFDVRFSPGVHKVTVIPGVPVASIRSIAITFNGVAGHRYYLGEIRTNPGKFQLIKDRTFRWQPFLIDMTTGRIIYPKNPRKLIHVGKK